MIWIPLRAPEICGEIPQPRYARIQWRMWAFDQIHFVLPPHCGVEAEIDFFTRIGSRAFDSRDFREKEGKQP